VSKSHFDIFRALRAAQDAPHAARAALSTRFWGGGGTHSGGGVVRCSPPRAPRRRRPRRRARANAFKTRALLVAVRESRAVRVDVDVVERLLVASLGDAHAPSFEVAVAGAAATVGAPARFARSIAGATTPQSQSQSQSQSRCATALRLASRFRFR